MAKSGGLENASIRGLWVIFFVCLFGCLAGVAGGIYAPDTTTKFMGGFVAAVTGVFAMKALKMITLKKQKL